MHDPVGFLGLLLLPVVGVEHKYFLVPFDFVAVGIKGGGSGENGPGFASFVPASLVPFSGICEYFSPLSGSGGVCFGWPVEEVPDQPIFAHSCISKGNSCNIRSRLVNFDYLLRLIKIFCL